LSTEPSSNSARAYMVVLPLPTEQYVSPHGPMLPQNEPSMYTSMYHCVQLSTCTTETPPRCARLPWRRGRGRRRRRRGRGAVSLDVQIGADAATPLSLVFRDLGLRLLSLRGSGRQQGDEKERAYVHGNDLRKSGGESHRTSGGGRPQALQSAFRQPQGRHAQDLRSLPLEGGTALSVVEARDGERVGSRRARRAGGHEQEICPRLQDRLYWMNALVGTPALSLLDADHPPPRHAGTTRRRTPPSGATLSARFPPRETSRRYRRSEATPPVESTQSVVVTLSLIATPGVVHTTPQPASPAASATADRV